MKGCTNNGKSLNCTYSKATHKDHRFRNDILKPAHMGFLCFYSAIERCALFVSGPIFAEVAWHVALRSLSCHMESSYLARNPAPLTKRNPSPLWCTSLG